MRSFGFAVAVAAVGVWTGAAAANDHPDIGPAPAWVKPVDLPPDDGKTDQAAIRMLLQDQQVDLQPGKRTVYTEVAIKIQTPEGLEAGNISFPWRPDTDTLTVHKLVIHRGTETIDVLANGQAFTVMRRETNLESAMLDGVLTANIQPEGLQVGDIVDFAVTVTSADPVLKGHVEQVGAMWNGIPMVRAHLKVQWPANLPVRWHEADSLPQVQPVTENGETTFELSADNLAPLTMPKNAPPRFMLGRFVEFTDFTTWSDLSALMAPLYDKAATIPPGGKLQPEIDRIKAASPDPKTRAEAALALVQDRTRYVLLAMGDGGLVPADAEQTWARRFGDCKGKTALLLALLHGLDIQAEPVIVNLPLGDGFDQRLPMVALFNHVLVRATIDGRAYWLDGTRIGDRHLDQIKTPAFRWGLPIRPAGATLEPIMPTPLENPGQEVALRVDASAGITLPAKAHAEMTLRGDAAIAANRNMVNLTPDARERALRQYWKQAFDILTPETTNAAFDPDKLEMHFVMDGTAKLDWTGNSLEPEGTGLGYRADFSRDPGPNSDAPFGVAFPFFSRVSETIVLPPNTGAFRIDGDQNVDQAVASVEYRRHASLANDTFTVETSQRSIAAEFPAADAPAAQQTLRDLTKKRIFLEKPGNYRMTDAELNAAGSAGNAQSTPPNQVFAQGIALSDRGRYDDAIAAFTKVLAADPKNVNALAYRALAYSWIGNYDAAQTDLDAATAVDAHSAIVFRTRGFLAERQGKWAQAVTAYSSSLEIEPNNLFSLMRRAIAYHSAGDDDHALADAATVKTINAKVPDPYFLRARILQDRGQGDQAAAEAAAMASANPNEVDAHLVAAAIYNQICHRRDDAMHEFDLALGIAQQPRVYLSRAETRAKTDLDGRRADIEAAIKLDPKSSDALSALARLQDETTDYAGAITTWSSAITAAPDDAVLLVSRGVDYARTGQPALSAQDFAAANGKAKEAMDYNNICWEKATARIDLDAALNDCNVAISKRPGEPGYLDSRGLVMLQLGRVDDAISNYTSALTVAPSMPSSLYGRAIAWARKGDKAKAEADATAALKADADISTDFAGYGLKLGS